MITYLKNENFNELVKDKKVVIDFYADWCMPCQMLGEILEEVIEENKDVNIVKINVDEHPEIARDHGVMSIPLVLLYNNGKIEKKKIGLMEKDEFLEWIK